MIGKRPPQLVLFQNLVTAAHLDGEVHPQEIAVLLAVQKRHGISDEERVRAFEQASSGTGPRFKIPKAPEERRLLFSGLCQIVVADGVLDPQERALVKRVAERFGLSDAELNSALSQARDAVRSAAQAPAKSLGERLSGALPSSPPAWTGLLVFVVSLVLGATGSGLTDSYAGRVSSREERVVVSGQSDAGPTINCVLHFGGRERVVAGRVYALATEGTQVEKRAWRPWWSVEGKSVLGPGALLALVLLFSSVLVVLGVLVGGPWRSGERLHPILRAASLLAGAGLLASAGMWLGDVNERPLSILPACAGLGLWIAAARSHFGEEADPS